MTLSKQLISGLLVILLLVFAGTLWINVNNTRVYIHHQLASHAQDTATSLGLSVAPYMQDEADLPIVDTMLNAIFDRGYYQQIILLNSRGEELLVKQNPLALDPVPDWFRHAFPLHPPTASSDISSGWNITGQLLVESHPGIGYQQLWQSARQGFWMTLGLFVLAGVMVWLVLKTITHPLHAVVNQAREIGRGNFVDVRQLPRTRELRTVVDAFNLMSRLLSRMFRELSKQAEQYREYAYRDALTGLSNRRAFEMYMQDLMIDREHRAQGYLLLIRLSSLAQLNQQAGAEQADSYIVKMVQIAQKQCNERSEHARLFRVGGADFAIVLQDCDEPGAQAWCEEMSERSKGLSGDDYPQGAAHIGASYFVREDKLEAIMIRADSALAVAEKLTRRWQMADAIDMLQSNMHWRETINQVLENKKVSFVLQPIKSAKGQLLYHECFARFSLDENTSLPVGQLIPASERLNYAPRIDQLVIAAALKRLADGEEKIGLNISAHSVADDDFCHWLLEQLGTYHAADKESATSKPGVCQRLVIEFSEHCVGRSATNLKALSKEIKRMGGKITIEHFGASMAPFGFIRQLAPDCIKLDGSFVRGIDKQPDNQFFVQSLVNIAHGQNIQVIAEKVETAAEANALQSLFIDHLQGYFVSQPTSW